MGGFDVQGLPLVASILGVGDVEMLLHRLVVIKHHRTQKEDAQDATRNPVD
jgi:hypothetical protein